MNKRKLRLGPDHPETLTSMANLATLYRKQGRWEEAERLQVFVMHWSKERLGLDHPKTLASMSALAATYWNQGRWDEAEKLNVDVMNVFNAKLGSDHQDTFTSMVNLATTYTIREDGMKQRGWKLRSWMQEKQSMDYTTHTLFVA